MAVTVTSGPLLAAAIRSSCRVICTLWTVQAQPLYLGAQF
jgi:hypothetical protein